MNVHVSPVAVERPTQEEAEAAVRTLLAWAGEDPQREGLLETPKRVTKAYGEFFGGYHMDPAEILGKTFKEVGGYDDMVLVKDIPFSSHCEHHMVPFIGKVHIAYLPDGSVVGLSKLARLVEAFGRRLQVQENMTAQLVDAMVEHLKPRGVAVMVSAEHFCMSMRGVKAHGASTVTHKFAGEFKADVALQDRFLRLVKA